MKNLPMRSFAPDLIRALAICGVLLIHLTYPIYARPDFLGGGTWWLAQIINAVFRISIPLFIMLSGYLLLHKNETIEKTVQRTVLRLVVPLLGWTIIYAIWDVIWFNHPIESTALVKGLLSGGANHLYFLGILINLYLLLPVLRLFWQHSNPLLKQYLLVLSLGFGWIYTALGYFVFEQEALMPTIFTIGLPYLGYFLIGGYMRSIQPSVKQLKLSASVWFFATVATAVLGFYALTLFASGTLLFAGTVPYFDNYLSFNVGVAAISAFIVLISAKNQEKTLTKQNQYGLLHKGIPVLASVSFGLYIMHPLLMNVLDYYFSFQVDFMNYSLLSYLLFRSLLVFVSTIVVSFVCTRLPIISKLLGE